jgi:hypothetical protein
VWLGSLFPCGAASAWRGSDLQDWQWLSRKFKAWCGLPRLAAGWIAAPPHAPAAALLPSFVGLPRPERPGNRQPAACGPAISSQPTERGP